MLTSHAYGLNQCVKDPSSPVYPTVPNLVGLAASRGEVGQIGPYVALAHRNGAAYRIDEMGSVTCNGRRGVSDTLASALWVMDALFTMAGEGVDGVNLHTYPNSANGLFDFSTAHGHPRASVHPLYYGALMFAQAAPGRVAAAARRLEQPGARCGRGRRGPPITRPGPAHQRQPEQLRAGRRAHARRPGAGCLERLRASSAYATSGLTLGGQTFGAAHRHRRSDARCGAVRRPHGGTYSVTLPAGSAALLTLARAAAADPA